MIGRVGRDVLAAVALATVAAACTPPLSFFRRRRAGCRSREKFRYAHFAGYRAVMWSEMGLMHAMMGALRRPPRSHS